MADKVTFKTKVSGFYDVRRMPKLVQVLDDIAEQTAEKANRSADTDEYETGSQQGQRRPQGRWRATVFTAGNHAKRDNAKHNTLLKALE